jgi:two-component system, cell cycle sensor histidine kinase and response regulator CckA
VTVLDPALGAIKADAGHLEQVVLNLVVNARDAMADTGGRITIETSMADVVASAKTPVDLAPGRYVILTVSDTGAGIPPEIQAQIFEPFFTTKAPDKGTGLGLSTVYGIVKQSHGSIAVESEPGRGSTFRIYLPLVDTPVERLGGTRAAPVLTTGSETILLVEDADAGRRRTWWKQRPPRGATRQAVHTVRADAEGA